MTDLQSLGAESLQPIGREAPRGSVVGARDLATQDLEPQPRDADLLVRAAGLRAPGTRALLLECLEGQPQVEPRSMAL